MQFNVSQITYRMRTLRDLVFRSEKRKHVSAFGLEKYIIDEFDRACLAIPQDVSCQLPHALTRHPLYILATTVKSLLDWMLYVCAISLSSSHDISLGTVIVMKSASASLSQQLGNMYANMDRVTEELRSTKSYLKSQ